eukprot:m.338198 g.338198  ORF g.338198 m.338198 type:complete len:391 (+) comp18338_c0_seq1:121-1293(+)
MADSSDVGSRKRTTSFADQAAQAAAQGAGDNAELSGLIVKETPDGHITTVVATSGTDGTQREISYTDTSVVGNGSFGVVFQVTLLATGEKAAIKKVLQDRRFKNRELPIMKKLHHENIVKLLFYFHSPGQKQDEVYLNLVLEFIPETVYQVARTYARTKQPFPIFHARLYVYQMFRSLAFVHNMGVCHRDIKPQNLLVNPQTGVLKLCDFGSAKVLVPGEANVSYICSRYYRAPELIFGATDYTNAIDVWSAGCVVAELLLGQPVFPGESGVDQLVEIIKVLGTPTRQQIKSMNPNYTDFRFPQIRAQPWEQVFRSGTPLDAINLCKRLLQYTPTTRVGLFEAMADPFFDPIRDPKATFEGRPLPPLFNFTQKELQTPCAPGVLNRILPC